MFESRALTVDNVLKGRDHDVCILLLPSKPFFLFCTRIATYQILAHKCKKESLTLNFNAFCFERSLSNLAVSSAFFHVSSPTKTPVAPDVSAIL